jgi:hypothetical protein
MCTYVLPTASCCAIYTKCPLLYKHVNIVSSNFVSFLSFHTFTCPIVIYSSTHKHTHTRTHAATEMVLIEASGPVWSVSSMLLWGDGEGGEWGHRNYYHSRNGQSKSQPLPAITSLFKPWVVSLWEPDDLRLVESNSQLWIPYAIVAGSDYCVSNLLQSKKRTHTLACFYASRGTNKWSGSYLFLSP